MVWIINTIAILITAYLIPGIKLAGFVEAVFAAAILGILNALIKPILIFLTFPITLITLGLFLFVINAVIFYVVGLLSPGFKVESFWSALLASIVVSIVSFLTNALI